ncbi:MAG TPA: VgrG-related protein, partial [Solirubrobacteraceae bacterium]|nr:VgrG-related protein [Solirubrobacteraceae bacterium]
DVKRKLLDVVADGRLRLPDRLTVRINDTDLKVVDGGTFKVGADIQVRLGSDESGGAKKVFDGQITALEPEFTARGAELVVSALDRGHLLQREVRTATYTDMSYGAIARKVASGAGLTTGSVDDGLTLAFVQQSNETDWEFLWRLALDVDYEVKVVGRQLNFRAAGNAAGSPVPLAWGKELLEFRPRVTGMQQVEQVTVRGWDPATQTAISAVASAPRPESRMGIARDDVVSALGAGGATISDHPVLSQSHAQTIAKSVAAQLASVYVEGEGIAVGTPALAAGAQAKIARVGTRFSGTYTLTGVRHVYRARSGYRTHFSISGRAHRTLLGLSSPPAAAGWAQRIVVGVVDSNEDPDKLGRVRVKYPALDETHPGWWARLVVPGAGATRGFVTLPQKGDEVLIAFEHGNEQHPYLLGSVFNTQAQPGEPLVTPDGSFGLATPHNVAISAGEKASLTAKTTMDLKSTGKATLSTKGEDGGDPAAVEVSASGALNLTAEQAATLEAKAGATITAKGELKVSGASVKISADGQVTVTGGPAGVKVSGGMVTIEGQQMVKISGPQVMLG